MSGLEKAKERLYQSNASLVVYDGKDYKEYYQKGIKDILEILKNDEKAFKDKVIADKVIGKVAGSLLAVAGVKEIYADTISELAIPILEKKNIYYEYKQKAEYIINRKKTGMCPMEEKFKNVENAETIYEELVK